MSAARPSAPSGADSRIAARAIDALRRGWPIGIGGLMFLPVETADAGRLSDFDPLGGADLLIAASRAATLNLGNQRDAASGPVRVSRAPWLDLPLARAVADPALDLAHPMKGPFRAAPLIDPVAAAAALDLARQAGLLPAFFMRDVGSGAVPDAALAEVVLTPDQAAAYEAPSILSVVARARLPVAGAEKSEIVAFRTPGSLSEQIALIVGTPDRTPPLIRLHSECLTGDVFGSLKCDCGPQLHAAIERIAAAGWGLLLYLRQEGRGIGLINKLRAYELQDQGFDTVDANLRLGFAVDARDFSLAARMLNLLNVDQVRLLTNNPEKVEGLRRAGITVVERVAHQLPANPHNHDYLATKRDRTGHWLQDEERGGEAI